MHALEAEYMAAFRAWDGVRMAEAASRMIELVVEKPLAAGEKGELVWEFREFLESITRHPNLWSSLVAGGAEFALKAEASWLGGRPTGIGVLFAPFHGSPNTLKRRWALLGFSSDFTFVARGELRVPYPLNGESGFREVSPPTIHAPPRIELPPHSTWATGRLLATGDGPWLARYRDGDRHAVWHEMNALGDAIRAPEVFGDAVDVALETMRRVREGVEILVRRLREAGYAFDDQGASFVPPSEDPDALIAKLETKVGLLPLSVCAFYRCVGSVDFRGVHPGWKSPGEAILDPLFVYPDKYILVYDEEQWSRHRYQLPISMDRYHKEDISGGEAYTIFVPAAGADAPVHHMPRSLSFVELLRESLAFGGFPGFAMVAPEARPQSLARLSEGVPLP
jgi:hypothetical protein